MQIEEKQIQEFISKAIVESALGKNIIDAINENLTGWKGESIIKEAIEAKIQLIANRLVMEEFRDTIEDKIRNQLKDKLIDELVNGYINKFHDVDWDKLF